METAQENALTLSGPNHKLTLGEVQHMADANFNTKFIHIVSRKDAAIAGLSRYFTGKPCLRGHISTRQTSGGGCIACSAERSNRPDVKRSNSEYGKRHYIKNREKTLNRGREYREKNREKFAEWMAVWRAKNPDKARLSRRISQSKRRASVKGQVDPGLREWIVNAKKTCYWCGIDCKDKYHIDHYVPLSKGGLHEVDNLVIACPPCNLTKSAKDPYEFAAEIGRLF